MSTHHPIEERERHRERMNRALGLGVAGFLVATVAAVFAPASVSDPLLFAGVGAYYLGVLGYLAVWRRTGVRLIDEREAAVERRASRVVSGLLLLFVVFGLPADVVLDATGAVDVPPAVRGAIWGYGLLLVVGAVAYGYAEGRVA
ncbi:hypothetical protein [Halostella litorea]|uniref:hypothetical protein n=1 Tax=Halostella litorea TaxID=2528831 RepID=UPI001091E663|nr:hypothetical protein [Halostella litorea]